MILLVHGLPISFNWQGGLNLVSVSSWKRSVARSDCVAVSTSVTGCSEKKCSPGSTAAVDCNVSRTPCAVWIKAARWASGSVANEGRNVITSTYIPEGARAMLLEAQVSDTAGGTVMVQLMG